MFSGGVVNGSPHMGSLEIEMRSPWVSRKAELVGVGGLTDVGIFGVALYLGEGE